MPDCIILPGSKNVVGGSALSAGKKDFDATIVLNVIKMVQRGVGVCGGYQMLGKLIRDPHQIETTDGAISGIGLLGVDTVMAREKTLSKREWDAYRIRAEKLSAMRFITVKPTAV